MRSLKNWWEDDETETSGLGSSSTSGAMKVHHLSAYPNRAWDAMKVSQNIAKKSSIIVKGKFIQFELKGATISKRYLLIFAG